MPKNKVVKPTNYEQSQIDKALAKKYPHMMKESWVKRLKKKVRKELEKRRGSTTYGLGMSGMSKKRAERLGGK